MPIILCGLSLSSAKAETTESSNTSKPKEVPYLGFAIGAGATWNSEFKTMQNYKPADAKNDFFLPLEIRAGYQFAYGKFIMPVELALGYKCLQQPGSWSRYRR